MGYYVELKAAPGVSATADEITQRLLLAGFTVHPDRGEPHFLFEFGVLTLNPPDKIKVGNWARVRMSWAAEEEELKRLIELAEKVGARVFDASIGNYVALENFETALAGIRKGYERVANLFGVVERGESADEGQTTAGPKNWKH